VSAENGQRRIVFVDEEPNILDGLRRLLHRKRETWDMRFAPTAGAALELMDQEPFDVIVADISMRGPKGEPLLDEVMRLHPYAVRIALSGQSDQGRILAALGATHQFLAKPCDPDKLRTTIACACALRDLLQERPLRELVGTLGALPSVPALYERLMEVMRLPDCAACDIGQIVAEDVGMAGKVLQLVNSAFFRLLHDAGKLVLLSRASDRFFAALAAAKKTGRLLHEAEREALGVSHAEVGAYLLGLWGLADAVVEAAAFHHAPGNCVFEQFGVLTAVHAADALVQESPEAYLNAAYLAKVGCADRLERWREATDRLEAKTAAREA